MKGHTYFNLSHGFAINEGEFPNICIQWWRWGFMIYVCLWRS